MPRLNPVKTEKLVAIIKRMGFEERRQKGSHISFYHPDGRALTIPFHKGKEVPKGLLNKIIKHDLKIAREDFEKFL